MKRNFNYMKFSVSWQLTVITSYIDVPKINKIKILFNFFPGHGIVPFHTENKILTSDVGVLNQPTTKTIGFILRFPILNHVEDRKII